MDDSASPTPPRPHPSPLPPHFPSFLEDLFPVADHPRLSLLPIPRIAAAGGFGMLAGGLLGFTHGSRTMRMRFRAENAHRMPVTTAAWFFYHRGQNHAAMRAGAREGVRMGARLAWWSALLIALEAGADRYRGQDGEDMCNTVAASVVVAVLFSQWNRFAQMTMVRTVRSGMAFGIVYGGAQDLLRLVKGQPIGYVETIRRRLAPTAKQERSSS